MEKGLASLNNFAHTHNIAFHHPGLLCMELKRTPQFLLSKYIVFSEYFSVCVSTKTTMQSEAAPRTFRFSSVPFDL